MRLAGVVLMVLLVCPAFAQTQEEPEEEQGLQVTRALSLENGFVEAALDVCLASVLSGEIVAQHADVHRHLRQASDETRAAHPFGGDQDLWELASRPDSQITLRSPDARTCSVFAAGALPAPTFEALAQALLQRGGFEELEIRRREEGRVQRTFRSTDGRTRIELEGFTSDKPEQNLSMAHIGRRR